MSSHTNHPIPKSLLALFLWLATMTLACAQGQSPRVSSPDGQIEFRLLLAVPPERNVENRLSYQVSFRGKPLLDTSLLGLQMQNQSLLGVNLKLTVSKTSSLDETYEIPVGKSRTVRNHYNSLVAEYQETGALDRRLNLEVRAYDDGVAFRYVIPQTAVLNEVRIKDEATQFQFAHDAETYPLILRNFRTSYEDQYNRMTLSGIHPEYLIAVPFLVEQPGVGWVAITEAHIENYAGMYLTHSDGKIMAAKLAPHAEELELAVSANTPLNSPWRVLMIAS